MSSPDTLAPHKETDAVATRAARCFASRDGESLMAYLHAMTTARAMGPSVSDAQLRHLEGQRFIVQHLSQLIARGRKGPTSPITLNTDHI